MVHKSAVLCHLRDVALNGAVVLPKRKLLWLLGWGQDRPGAWAKLLEFWEENGEAAGDLMGTEVGNCIVLTVKPVNKEAAHQLVSSWAA